MILQRLQATKRKKKNQKEQKTKKNFFCVAKVNLNRPKPFRTGTFPLFL
jgi:hypothetical protein